MPRIERMASHQGGEGGEYQGGVKITATDLRDVFATVVMDNVRNPIRRADSCHAAYFAWGQIWGQLPT